MHKPFNRNNYLLDLIKHIVSENDRSIYDDDPNDSR